ncbi:MAG: amidohydrolase family protein [Anaerolineales bacterium]|nr:amidohydrolase family protein [Anaerolineales bacterium]
MSVLCLPGLIDPHVHVRDLGQAHKEDWDSATAAALAGGITTVLAMPNTQPPIVDAAALTAYEQAAQARARCDYGLYLGAGPGNVGGLAALAPRAAGLKLYLDATFGDLKMDTLDLLAAHCAAWPADAPLLAHAEGNNLAAAILAAHLAGRAIHIVHVSRRDEIELIRAAKARGFAVTCEVCPHHLFLTLAGSGLPAGYVEVRPRLAAAADAAALWANLDVIDCFATDHAPHTRAEKEGPNPPPGYPGLETALALWLTAVHQGRLTLEDIIARMHTGPRRLFNLPEQPDTWIEVDPEQEWTPRGAGLFSRAGWTPFEGWPLRGRVTGVTLRGQRVYDGQAVLAPPGAGRNVRSRP